jgi:hypothetical protein
MAKTTKKSSKAGGAPPTAARKAHLRDPAWFSRRSRWVKSLSIAIGVALSHPVGILPRPFRNTEPVRWEPTLHGDDRILRGDRVFVNKWIFGLRYPPTVPCPITHYRLEYAKEPVVAPLPHRRVGHRGLQVRRTDAWNTTLVKRCRGIARRTDSDPRWKSLLERSEQYFLQECHPSNTPPTVEGTGFSRTRSCRRTR